MKVHILDTIKLITKLTAFSFQRECSLYHRQGKNFGKKIFSVIYIYAM